MRIFGCSPLPTVSDQTYLPYASIRQLCALRTYGYEGVRSTGY